MNTIQDRAQLFIRHWAQAHKQAVLYDEMSATLLDVASGKSMALRWRDVSGFEEKAHPESQENYGVLLFENGTQVALVDPGGVAFAPSTENSGAVENPYA